MVGGAGAAHLDKDLTVGRRSKTRSFLVLSFVAPEPNHEFAESGALECEPGCLKAGYPYGLPRLSVVELADRFRLMRT
jgi:hypothetical protein